MTHFRQHRIVPYTTAQMFALVADVESYPDFLPWCIGAQRWQGADGLELAKLTIGFRYICESYVSVLEQDPPHLLRMKCSSAPFRHMHGEWRFERISEADPSPLAPGDVQVAKNPAGASAERCAITFTIDFALQRAILDRLLGRLFTEATKRMLTAFQARAASLYPASTRAHNLPVVPGAASWTSK